MNTQHTPGPWSVIDGHYPSIKEVTGPSFKVSAVMWATDLTEDDYQKRNADLHLIAAAPDLLEALQHLMVAHGEQLDYAFQQAQAAIAKATNA
jgi:alkylated DNA repair dioxygenase AlkB